MSLKPFFESSKIEQCFVKGEKEFFNEVNSKNLWNWFLKKNWNNKLDFQWSQATSAEMK